MKLSDFLAGIEILRAHAAHEYVLGAGHDVFYFHTTDVVTDEEDARLRALGWSNTDDEIIDGEGHKNGNDGSWTCYV